jgi:hypothetical protein
MNVAQKVEDARRRMVEIEAGARQIKDNIRILLETDERMKFDEAYRNQIIGEKLKEVQKLQDESQVHQRYIFEHQQTQTNSTSLPRVTRSKTSAGAPSSLTEVAANIQQMTKQNQSVARSGVIGQRSQAISRKPVSEEDQKRSVVALHNSRKWLAEEENTLKYRLERDGLDDIRITEEEYDRFHHISSMRAWMESLCADIRENPLNETAVSDLRRLVRYVVSIS